MPVETRLITFTGPEVIEALVDFCEANGRTLRKGGIKRLILPDGADGNIGIKLEGDAPRITFYGNEAAAALLAYCKKKHIPVARRSDKSIEFKQGVVTLRLTIN